MRKFLQWLVSRLPKDTINVGGKPYLTRYYLFGKRSEWNVFVHCFHSSDQGDELHNHPWKWAVSLILSGGYSEEFRVSEEELFGFGGEFSRTNFTVFRREKRPGDLNLITSKSFHRVDLPRGEAWTLFVVGPRCQEWGFWDRHTEEFRDWTSNPEAIP